MRVLGREKQSVLASGRRSFGLCWCQCLLPAWKRCNMCKISESSWVRPGASDCWALFPALLLIWVMALVGLSGQKFDIACPNCSLRNQVVSRHPLFLTASQNSRPSLLPPCFSTWIMEVIAQMYPSDAQTEKTLPRQVCNVSLSNPLLRGGNVWVTQTKATETLSSMWLTLPPQTSLACCYFLINNYFSTAVTLPNFNPGSVCPIHPIQCELINQTVMWWRKPRILCRADL